MFTEEWRPRFSLRARPRWIRCAAACVTGLAFSATYESTAFAQTASQITPPSFRPNLERPGGFSLPGAPGLATPAGAEKLFVRLSGVRVEGGFSELRNATAALEARLIGKPVSGAEIFAAARDLEAAYAAAGYVLARVILPPQKLVDGSRLRLVVIDGHIQRLELKGVPERVRGRIGSLLAPLQGKHHVTQREIERALLLAGDTPGVILRSTLAPGEGQGAAVLVIEASYQPVSGMVSIDNSLSKALGQTVWGVGLDFNSVAGLGELIYLRANGHPEGDEFFGSYPRNRTLAAGAVVPLWIDGLSFNPEYTQSRTTPLPQANVATTDLFERMSLRLRYSWLRSRMLNYSQELSFDAQDETNSLFVGADPVPLSRDRLRIVRFTQDADYYTPWGATLSGRLRASFGIDGLGARGLNEATVLLPLSRQGADASFQKLDGSLNYYQSFMEHLAVNLAVRAQTSFGQPLLASERYSVADTASLSAFDTGSIIGDSGFVTRGELISPWTLPIQNVPFGAVAMPYIFGAYGEVRQVKPTALEVPVTRASAFGGGVRFGSAVPGTLSNGTLQVEYAHGESNAVGSNHRVVVTSAFRF
ncbi:ShlB/FhaC/HecB family hemolysin secretion/activation protein [Bradyrhizobium tropiciagri]|uniref:ShlB/FhaC/HecB family hemolysin secretion/activation protein n=1 Tax=Bradyrhizobium tropiciagri TaxID=312253 RepID=UPI001BABCE91|nr:ShlB/FhaC/HecB family hemolysin secretion/activation protein [Bradyrhizobium tropiciagri]MBR0893945.1 ShlB/FhaC/HecB family hemolysin secretion/activation protein [Bradyrhizobium tropiciagri]